MAEPGSELQRRFHSFSNRIASIEKRINSIDHELQIIETDSVEKHKEVLKVVRGVKDDIARFSEEIAESKKFIGRVNQRLGEFASRESVKILEKYINMWSPIKHVTRKEVQAMIEDALVEASKKPAKKVARKKAPRKKKVARISYAL
tara:strand:- start:491 stop:931 length:441 start_codon:yes stop_codon:yes gene_type:complete